MRFLEYNMTEIIGFNKQTSTIPSPQAKKNKKDKKQLHVRFHLYINGTGVINVNCDKKGLHENK